MCKISTFFVINWVYFVVSRDINQTAMLSIFVLFSYLLIIHIYIIRFNNIVSLTIWFAFRFSSSKIKCSVDVLFCLGKEFHNNGWVVFLDGIEINLIWCYQIWSDIISIIRHLFTSKSRCKFDNLQSVVFTPTLWLSAKEPFIYSFYGIGYGRKLRILTIPGLLKMRQKFFLHQENIFDVWKVHPYC